MGTNAKVGCSEVFREGGLRSSISFLGGESNDRDSHFFSKGVLYPGSRRARTKDRDDAKQSPCSSTNASSCDN